jgi:hypothetical protein
MRCRESLNPRFAVIAFALALVTGCDYKPPPVTKMSSRSAGPVYHGKLESVAYYEKMLLDKSFRWDGPCSREDRIPVLHAARALAYIGDPAVPALFRAIRNESVDYLSVLDSLSEIGLPVNHYCNELRRPDPTAIDRLERWWTENHKKTVSARSEHRVSIGLPSVEHSR